MDQLFEYITKRIKLSDDAKELIRTVTKIRNVKKGEYLINQGLFQTVIQINLEVKEERSLCIKSSKNY